jgi:hypothetical protein
MNQPSRQARLLVELAQGADDPDARTQARVARLLSARLAIEGALPATPQTAAGKAALGGLSTGVKSVVVALVVGGPLAGLGWLSLGHAPPAPAVPAPAALHVDSLKANALAPVSPSAAASANPPLSKLAGKTGASPPEGERTPNLPETPSLPTSPERRVATANAPPLAAPRRVAEPAAFADDTPAQTSAAPTPKAHEGAVSGGQPEPQPEPSATPDPLAAEAAALREAQRALRDGRASHAIELLAAQDARFARGSLQQERAAARVLALCQAGSRDRARAEAAQFASRWPRSALLSRVQAACSNE